MKADGKLDSIEITAWARLLRVSTRLRTAVEDALKSTGLPPLAWYDALLELRRAGDGGLRPGELEREMLLPQYNVSRLLDRLVEAGCVMRLPHPEDRRGQIVRITGEGEELLRRMWRVYRAIIGREFAAKLADGDAATLAELLGRLR